MNKTTKLKAGLLSMAAIACCTVLAGVSRADCGSSMAIQRFAVANEPEPTSAPDEAGLLNSRQIAPQNDDSRNGSIVGLWKATFTSGGQVVDQGFDLWTSDGTEILNDTPAPATGNVCLGVWVRSGATFKLKHPSWTFDAAGNLNGTAVIREQVMLDRDGNSYRGSFTVDVFDLAGKKLFHLAGAIVAQRITVDF